MKDLVLIAMGAAVAMLIAKRNSDAVAATLVPSQRIPRAYDSKIYNAIQLPETYPSYIVDPWTGEIIGATGISNVSRTAPYSAAELATLYL